LKSVSVTTAPNGIAGGISSFATPTVVGQTPPPGTRVTPGTVVSLQVARS
jgi:beta-lactam-binding protein with PASTA domain